MTWNTRVRRIISNTSPLVYLHRIQALGLLRALGDETWIPRAVVEELAEGSGRGYDVPDPGQHDWLRIVDPRVAPSEWLAFDLGRGELAVLALAVEHPGRTVLMDDRQGRRIAHTVGLNVRGTLGVLLEAKKRGLTARIEPFVNRLEGTGMWMSDALRDRVLALAGEARTVERPSGRGS